MLCQCEGGASPLVFSTNFTVRSSFSTDSYDKSSGFLTWLIIHFWTHHVGQFCTGWGKKSNYICPDSCGKQQIWKEEVLQVKAGWVSFNFGPSSGNPLLPACQEFLILICSPLHLFSGFPLPPRSVCGLLLLKDKRSAQPPALHSGHCSSAWLGPRNSWGPSALGAWLLLPQVHLLSHSAMLGCQVFHLGNTWHFQPQGLSTDAISKIIFQKATNILNS